MPPPKRSIWFRLARSVWNTVRVVGIVYLSLLLLLLIFEDELVHPAPKYPRGNWQPKLLEYEDVHFASADGTKLHGWYVEHPDPQAHVIYLHGNGQNIASLDAFLNRMSYETQASIFAIDWRGYGKSEGSANEAGVLADSEAAVEWLCEREELAPSQLIMHGRSLGGAPAVHLAAMHQARGLIVEDSFSSMPDVAAPLYPWAPVRLLMRTQYDSATKIRNYHGTLLQFHGTHDRLVPPMVAMKLHRAAVNADKKLIVLEEKGHNDPPPEAYFAALGEFFARLEKSSSADDS